MAYTGARTFSPSVGYARYGGTPLNPTFSMGANILGSFSSRVPPGFGSRLAPFHFAPPIRYVPNPAGIQALKMTPEMLLALKEEAWQIAVECQRLAAQEAYDTGAYFKSIKATAGIDASIRSGVGRVNAYDWKAHWIEWGTIYHKPKSILKRGAEAAGYHVRPDPKPAGF